MTQSDSSMRPREAQACREGGRKGGREGGRRRTETWIVGEARVVRRRKTEAHGNTRQLHAHGRRSGSANKSIHWHMPRGHQ